MHLLYVFSSEWERQYNRRLPSKLITEGADGNNGTELRRYITAMDKFSTQHLT